MHFNPCLNAIKTYQAGRPIEEVVEKYGIKPQEVIKLASNENPYGCSKLVLEALQKKLSFINLYPDDSMSALKALLSQKFHISPENLIIGAGSDQILEFCVRAKCNEKSKVLMAGITFAMYEIYAKQVGAQVLKTTSHEHDLEEFLDLYAAHKPEIIFLCTPNNPLGECLDAKAVEEFLENIDKECLVILDGAYQEYASYKDPKKALDPKLFERFGNVILLRTFSKAYGLGGMRMGYGIAEKSLISQLYKMRPPFNVGTLSLEAACAALGDEVFVRECIAKNFTEMQKYKDFADAHGIEYLDSWSNFIVFFCEGKRLNSSALAEAFMQKGIIIRDLASYGMNAVRITIGTEEQNLKVFSFLQAFLS
ncbi:histidinol-phosphate transaminase [Helicobacter mustelae]|uniref:Histidinol-phosphate aminotransferase n=1 Tax=Helicobacter mustelae (strain ATCC 43772 / CCUG 25715 / CIP 103759 / LMG 18044 / NCTC 12198 / R85-136P) TaxID=679897 RepID=D3UIW8_HELM1|nr:histidinol-phosphate transaminase [Helicobacter mustelae]CBG40443.1 probable histidinol-phosphate aminotransferase [Helicobacter mustelae 12198]SQH71943.1 histidinol-phosphate aminotransferase [Helicobacter mustelae]